MGLNLVLVTTLPFRQTWHFSSMRPLWYGSDPAKLRGYMHRELKVNEHVVSVDRHKKCQFVFLAP
jgi:hypothetical protein